MNRLAAHAAACLLLAFASACSSNSGSSPTSPTGTRTSTTSTTTTSIGSSGTVTTSTTTSVPTVTLAATKFLAFGDSMTAGQSATVASRPMELTTVTSYPLMLERDLRAMYTAQDVRVTNAGKSGEWAADGMFRLRAELVAAAPQAVLLLEGVNDLGAVGVTATVDSLDYMIQLCQAQRATVFVATLPPERPGGVRTNPVALITSFNDGIRRIARNRGAVLVDLDLAFGNDYTLLSEDGLHPNAAGYQRMAQTFLAAIRSTLERKAGTTAAPTN